MMPNVPTVAEAGLPGFELESWVALYAPGGTPAPIVNKLTQDVKKALEQPEAKQRADAAGIELRYLNPQATDALLKREIALTQKAIKAANIKID
jgi:tripartite-type tricarboxylate transporter receptor subunit TctC